MLADESSTDPLAATKRRLKAYLKNYHKLRELSVKDRDFGDVGNSAGFAPGSWWELLACKQADVTAAMKRLTERQRRAVVYWYVYGLSQDEVAELLGIVYTNNLRRLVVRAIAGMAEHLGENW